MVDQIQNFVRGQLTQSVSNSTSTFPVGDAGAFPDPGDGEYDVTVFDGATYQRAGADPAVEIVRVLGRDTSADELTVARGQQNTSAEPHPDTSVIVQGITAGLLQQLDQTTLSETLDANGNDVTNVGALDVEDITSTKSLTGESLGLSETADPTTWLSHESTIGNVDHSATTVSVTADNSTTTIHQASANGGLFVISGREDGESNAFTDIVLQAGFSSVSAISESAIRDNPVPRSYSEEEFSQGDLQLALDGSGETYNVAVEAVKLL